MVKHIPLFLLVALLLIPMGAHAEEMVINRILVKINDTIITEYDLNEEMTPILKQLKGRTLSEQEKAQLTAFRRKTLQEMVNDELVQQEANRLGIQIDDERVNQEITRVREDQGFSEEEFEAKIKEDGLDMDDFRERMRKIVKKQELIGYMVNRKVLVTDTEIQEEYNAHIDDYTLDKMVDLAIISLPSNISALEVKKRIVDGDLTFADAVAKYSVGPGLDNGGSLGEVAVEDLSDAWRSAINGLEEGEISDPFLINGKESLLMPRKIMDDRVVPLEEVRDGIYKRLRQKKRETIFDEYFEQLKAGAVIVYMDKDLMPDGGER